MKPLLAHIYEAHRVAYPCFVQPKLNGIRALYQGGNFQSRDEIPFPPGLLEHLTRPLRETFAPEVILDGELYVHGWPLQRINAAVTPVRQMPTEDTEKVEYHVFDVVDYSTRFIERAIRRQNLEQVKIVATNFASSEETANTWYAHFVNLGYEGMMYRLGDCPYTVPKQRKEGLHFVGNRAGETLGSNSRFLSDKDNRCWHLLKRKDWQDHEFTCTEVVEGEGKLKGTLGAIVCRIPGQSQPNSSFSLKTFSVGSGLTDSQRHYYWNNPPIGKLIKVKYLVLSSDGIPLNPTVHPDHIIQ